MILEAGPMSGAINRGESWSESDSDHFIDYGAYFVPERAVQIDTICSVISGRKS